ncbi:ketoacyl-ACP synthase III [Chryseobacterium joostei]|uniref:3-oxoacyl-[acyl-carrier-protein] synthase-3 n=1 Tax=Chryseobacterium joostei TaxID=112234 RepID=A0A1N7I3N4_9FLAO|nr:MULTISPECIES: ketoacyl-ACP synthase III [Chryseobacterium]AZA99825.1 ketoacyl-ACP synthase III [Chryseobacterium joostei]SIS31702.1 3-oxoacyl-[acyl-carrier-protein] synthase-3 [Chryseobacterium joostei]HCM33526.1 ketoacyl-ACP synthase III [Chryseobacterium sp.]
MKIDFSNKKITGILSILPSNEVLFEDEMHNYSFSEAKSLKLKAAMGFKSKRVVADESTTSFDLVVKGLDYLFENNLLDKDSIDAILFVSQSPEYIMPPTSNLLHGKYGLDEKVYCLDINQGCAGFVVGLQQSFMLLNNPGINKVVLCNADVLSPKVSKFDRNSNPLIGDAAAITIIENTTESTSIIGEIRMDGSGAMALNVPAGGARMPITEETSELYEDTFGNKRSKNHLVMQGDNVFNFVQTKVPEQIKNIVESSNDNVDTIDYFLFHQPNRFMLQKLADKIGVSRDKLPFNVVENFGNSSGVTIPVVTTFNLGDQLEHSEMKVCFSGFGVGLTWGTIIMNLGNLDFCKLIYK